eukprot:TRINITY_DN9954_c0_g2_i1.p1 TRINITY_DN9954_c0_g2~~TRINITY_DN9954_c0_g2_i1.p1  ORF type:complete len:210 (+),score=43.55 TRINITY_DN9954_c0_g2_i1:3-632(+)
MARQTKGSKKKQPLQAEDTSHSDNEVADDKKDKKPVVIEKWDSQTVKNTLDQVLREETLKQLPDYSEIHTEEDFKLWTAGIGCFFAGMGCIYGLVVPHPDSSPFVGVCVVVYFVLMTILNAHAMFFDSKLALYAKHKENDQAKLRLRVTLPRFNPNLTITMFFDDNGTTQEVVHKGHVGEFFYENGELGEEAVSKNIAKLLAQRKQKDA